MAHEDKDHFWRVRNERGQLVASGLFMKDARLIAAAPDLLAALKGCCSRIGDKWHRLGCEAFSQPFGECDYACVQARAAIAQAKGDA